MVTLINKLSSLIIYHSLKHLLKHLLVLISMLAAATSEQR
jgi:hypothetical protein